PTEPVDAMNDSSVAAQREQAESTRWVGPRRSPETGPTRQQRWHLCGWPNQAYLQRRQQYQAPPKIDGRRCGGWHRPGARGQGKASLIHKPTTKRRKRVAKKNQKRTS